MLKFEVINLEKHEQDEMLNDAGVLPDRAILPSEHMMANTATLVRAFCSCLAYGKVPVWYWDERRHAPLVEFAEQEVKRTCGARITAMVSQLVSDIEMRGQQVTPEIRATLCNMVTDEYLMAVLSEQKMMFDRLRAPLEAHGSWLGVHYELENT